MDEPRSRASDLDPRVSLGMVLLLPLSRVPEIRRLIGGVPDVRVVLAKVATPRRLWITEADSEPPRGDRP
jgi:hypothetical protein